MEKELQQLEIIRKKGLVNMLDGQSVLEIAECEDFWDLVAAILVPTGPSTTKMKLDKEKYLELLKKLGQANNK